MTEIFRFLVACVPDERTQIRNEAGVDPLSTFARRPRAVGLLRIGARDGRGTPMALDIA
jgi:hypothetical protein